MSSVLWAEGRRGLKDAQNAVLNPWQGFVATHEEPGTIGSPTQAIVTNEILGRDSFENVLNEYAARGGPTKEPQREQQIER